MVHNQSWSAHLKNWVNKAFFLNLSNTQHKVRKKLPKLMSHVQNLAKLETFRPTALLGTSATKKWENVGILKTQEWGGVYPNPTSFVI